MLGHLINFFYPPRCAACWKRLRPDTSRRLCADCLGRIDRLSEPLCAVCGIPLESVSYETDNWCARCAQRPPHFTKARAAVCYRAGADDESLVVPSMIRRHKYGLDQSLAAAIAECIGDSLPLKDTEYDLVVPVPLHRARLWWRGFNQAALLAAVVARRLGCRLDVTALTRVRATPPQTARDRTERSLNVRNAFTVRRPERVASRRVLLVDDVMTTGATADECARTLLAAGARRVDVFTMARVV